MAAASDNAGTSVWPMTDLPAPPTSDARSLDELEADLAAVASAMETLDRIVAESGEREGAAAEIAAVVSADRFRIDPPSAAPQQD